MSNRSIHPNALPNYENADIPREKLEGYALNPMHRAARQSGSHGKHHAFVFKSVLDFDQSNWELLEQQIREGLPYHEAILKKDFEYGKLFEVVMSITGPNGRTADVLTAWIIRTGTGYPFLVTTYVTRK